MGIAPQPPPEEMLFGYTAGMFLSITIEVIRVVIFSIAAVLVTLISAGLIHVVLMMTGETRYGYETTYRVSAYAGAATQVVYLVPCFGWLFAAVWCFVVMTIGIDRAQDVGTGRALGAVLVPYLLCCGTLALGFGLLVTAFYAMFEGTQGPFVAP
jgi:hypothetical protein